MKKDLEIVVLLYVGVFLFTYFLSLSTVKLENGEDINIRNQELVLETK